MSPNPDPHQLLDAYGREEHRVPYYADTTLRDDAAPAAFTALRSVLSRHCRDLDLTVRRELVDEAFPARCVECDTSFPCRTVQEIIIALEST